MRSNISNIQENVENSTKTKLYSVSEGKKNNLITKSLLNNNNKFIYKK